MQWNDTGVILSTSKYGENSLILRIFTPSHGVHAGLVRPSKKSRATYQTGNIVDITWKARLEEHLGNFVCEPKSSVIGFVLGDPAKLSGLQSACAMIEQTMPERDPHPELYYTFEDFILHLRQERDCFARYILFEIELLRNLGFGLDLEKCAATGTKENLIYISPKTGRAVSAEAGEPYKDRLFKIPSFFYRHCERSEAIQDISAALDCRVELRSPRNNETNQNIQEIREGLQLTRHFLTQFFFEPHHKKMPAARDRLQTKIFSLAE